MPKCPDSLVGGDGDCHEARALAGAAAGYDVDTGRQIEELAEPVEGGDVKAAERIRERIPDVAERRLAEFDVGDTLPETERQTAAPKAVANETLGQTQDKTGPQPGRRRLDQPPLQGTHRFDGPFRRVFAGRPRDGFVGRAFLAQKTEDGVQRRQSDRAVAQTFGVQPAFIEGKTLRNRIRDALMQAGDEHTSDAGLTHNGIICWVIEANGMQS